MKTDDPKFTAHALGELEDLTPTERAEIESLIADDTHAAAEAVETKKLGARLRDDLQREESQPLTSEQRATVLAATHARSLAKASKIIPFWRRATVVSAIAACAIVGLFMWMLNYALRPDGTARRRDLASMQEIAVPVDSLPEGPTNVEMANPPDSLTMQGAGTANIHSPTVDVTFTLAGGAFKVAPASGVSPLLLAANGAGTLPSSRANAYTGAINLAAGSLVVSSGNGSGTPSNIAAGITGSLTAAGNVTNSSPHLAQTTGASGGPVNVPGTMRSRVGGGKADTANNAARAIAMWEAEAGWQRPTLRLERNVVTVWPSNEERDVQSEAVPSDAASFATITDNPFLPVREHPLSTFSTDVDTASYAIVRRFLNEQQRPPKGAVRIEELLNYFTYDYPQPKGDAPFSATMEVAACPWTPEHRLVRIGLKGREIAKDKRPASNLVFLLDVSGSMQPANRLPLLKQSLGLLIDQLGAEDRVAIVVYAGSSGCVLESTSDKAEMRLALSRLEAGGSTNGGSGIQLAYDIAKKHFIKGGTNRVILGTDGDWNVGITNQNDLFNLITQRAKSGVFLTALGFGMGNLKDSMLVKLADKGNGNYGYIDTLLEAKKLLVDQLSGTLVTIAKDVKIQVEFNPAHVAGYRLIGYEKRLLAKEDFNDDKKDAGEIGAGHTVTALYEIVPAGKELPRVATVDPLKYQAVAAEKSEIRAGAEVGGANQKPESSPELLTLKLRYKAPDGDTSKLLEFPLTDTGATWEKSSRDLRFAAAVAGYGMLLRDSAHKGNATWNSVHELAVEGKGEDVNGYRAEFLSLIEKAQLLMR